MVSLISEARISDPEAASAEYGSRVPFRPGSACQQWEGCPGLRGRECSGAPAAACATLLTPLLTQSGGRIEQYDARHCPARKATRFCARCGARGCGHPSARRRRLPSSRHCLRTYRVSSVRGDRYAGEWVTRVGVPQTGDLSTSIRTKRNRPCISTSCRCSIPRAVDLLDHDRLVRQLVSLERRTGRSTGRDIIDHPPGLHDDVANAVAGAVVSMPRRGGGRVRTMTGSSARLLPTTTTRWRFGNAPIRWADPRRRQLRDVRP